MKEPAGPSKAQYVPYRPPNGDFTPPASPQPMSPYAAPIGRKGYGSRSRSSSRQPARLQMDTSMAPAYERPMYSPSPSSSPPLPPLPSPKFAQPRQRAPSLLRHTAISSPLNNGYPRAEQVLASPTFGPVPMRHASGPGPTSDPRSIFNALGSNPVNPHSPTHEALYEESSGAASQQRMRGMTNSSQPSYRNPPLRTATSIPDYGPIRTGERSNLSGAYRPHRGGPNWSHNDHYPPRYFRGEEPRASFRSGQTNASSIFMETSGTERSSMATGRSSIMSDTHLSTYSRDRSEERDLSSDTLPTSISPDEEDIMSTVEDVIDAYFEDDMSQELSREDSDEQRDRSPTTPTPDQLQVQPQDYARQRSSEEIPRPASIAARSSVLGMPKAANRLNKPVPKPNFTRKPSGDIHKLQEMHREISGLPQLPKKKSRLSRQDWEEIQAYSNRNSRGATAMLREAISETSVEPPNTSVALPEVDEDEAFPRRASTSVFDRRSTLFNLGNLETKPLSKSKTTEFGNPLTPKPTGSFAPLRKALSGAERDRYGFKKATHNISLQEYDSWVGKYDEHITRRRNKWTALMSKQGLSTSDPSQFPEPCDKVKRYARKGYPPEWRGAMWWFYSGGQYKIGQPEMAGLYASLVERINQGELNKDDREAIERDLDRTFPDNVHFRPDPTEDDPEGTLSGEPSLITDLREVLACFALNNPNIGYCQSLNFIAGLLLLFMKQNKERAFILLTIITHNHLPGAHARSLANTEVNVLMMLIRDYLPKVWASINDTDLVNSGPGSKAHPDSKFQRQPTVALSCTSWFMSIFVGVLPIETVLRVWDAFLYEGPRALYRYALAIFKHGEAEIRKYRPGDGELFMAVQNLPRRCLNPNVLHDIAFVKKGFGSLTQNVIDQKRLFWRDQNDRAKRSASHKRPGVVETSGNGDDAARGLGGLKRKASRRFLKRKNTGLV
ncbi:hypothetical protein CC80DRAFT_406303 [Byssothecium circinans]|uniref:Rab-GAP TBC domain-containing protein n=1 Tax=Byssothecium circinans TaxID=147558 RepID=A0A6A5U663_9PLEO|nr:hypothetical protein CC80DRAFT_406303 [Byssothecium circinans]